MSTKKLPITKLRSEAKRLGLNTKMPLAKLRTAVAEALEAESAPKKKATTKKSTTKKPSARNKPKAKEEAPDTGDLVEEILTAVRAEYDSQLDELRERVTELESYWEEEGEEEESDADADEEEDEEDDEEDAEEDGDEEEDEEEDDEEEDTRPPKLISRFFVEEEDGSYGLCLEDKQIEGMNEKELRLMLDVLGVDASSAGKGKVRLLQGMLRKHFEEHAEDPDEFVINQHVVFIDENDEEYDAWIADPDEHGEAEEEDEVRIVFDDGAILDVDVDSLQVAEDE